MNFSIIDYFLKFKGRVDAFPNENELFEGTIHIINETSKNDFIDVLSKAGIIYEIKCIPELGEWIIKYKFHREQFHKAILYMKLNS